jgi:glucosaminylphosphatidylinositol acyltransferase
MLGLSLGTKILAPTPSFFRRIQKQLKQVQQKDSRDKDVMASLSKPRQYDKIVTDLLAYSFLWWIVMYAVMWFQEGVSRRMVSLSPVV